MTNMLHVKFIFRAPADCFQYFTGASGNIKSFNFVDGLTGGSMLQSQLYTACVRQEQGEIQSFIIFIF